MCGQMLARARALINTHTHRFMKCTAATGSILGKWIRRSRTASTMFQKKNSSHVTWSHYKFDRTQQTNQRARMKRRKKNSNVYTFLGEYLFIKWTVCEMRREHFKRTIEFFISINCLNEILFWSLLVFDFKPIYRLSLSLFFCYSISKSVLLFYRYRRVFPNRKVSMPIQWLHITLQSNYRRYNSNFRTMSAQNNWMGIFPINCKCELKYRNSSQMSLFFREEKNHECHS